MKKRSSGQRIRWMAGLLLCEAILSSAFPVLADERIEQAERYGEYYRHPSQTITAHTSELEEPGEGDTLELAEITVNNGDEFIAAMNNAVAGVPCTIVLGNDVLLTEEIVVETGKVITLIDDGETRTISSDPFMTLFTVQAGGKLTLAGSDTGRLVIDGTSGAGQLKDAGRVVSCQGTFVLAGAEICNATSWGIGAGIIYISGMNSLFEMKSGVIRNNQINGGSLSSENATVHAAGGATVRISGGKIINNIQKEDDRYRYCTAGVLARSDGGAVKIEMTGGEISGNLSRGGYSGGGGIWLCGDTWRYGYTPDAVTMTMSGDAKITNNTTDYAGGGVFVYGNASLTMDGGEISGNTVTDGFGGGVATYDYLKDTGQPDSYIETWEQFVHTAFVMNEGKIVNNTADRDDAGFGGGDGGCGGGLYVASNNVELHGGEIRGNLAARQGGGVYVGSTPYKLFLYDALITRNAAELLGGGLWLCPTGSAESYVENGGAIFDNTAEGVGDDVASLLKSGGAILSLTNRLLGNWLVHWYEDGQIDVNSGDLGLPVEQAPRYPDTDPAGGLVVSAENLALKAVAAQEGKAKAEQEARLKITENTAVRGGGIGSNGAVIFNRYPVEYPTVDVSVTKKWEDDADGHPEQVTVYLYQDGVKIDEVTLGDHNHWTTTFQDLPRYQNNALEMDQDKVECQYTVAEKEIEGYTGIIEKEKDNQYALIITNKKDEPRPTGSLKISKIVTGEAIDANLKFTFTVTFTAADQTPLSGIYSYTGNSLDGVPPPASGSFELDAAGKVSFELSHGQGITITGLPEGIHYVVEERHHDGYMPTIRGAAQGTIQDGTEVSVVFENHKDGGETPRVDVTVKKVWILDNGRTAAESVTIDLLRDGQPVDSVVLNEKGNWEYTWTDLDGTCDWSVRESKVPEGFTMSLEQSGFTFTISNDDIAQQPTPTPEKPDEPRDQVPNTSDTSYLSLWAALSAISGAGMIGTWFFIRKEKRKSRRHKHRGTRR